MRAAMEAETTCRPPTPLSHLGIISLQVHSNLLLLTPSSLEPLYLLHLLLKGARSNSGGTVLSNKTARNLQHCNGKKKDNNLFLPAQYEIDQVHYSTVMAQNCIKSTQWGRLRTTVGTQPSLLPPSSSVLQPKLFHLPISLFLFTTVPIHWWPADG